MEDATAVTISYEDYLDLVEDQRLLNCLRNAGVDNWDGWDFALEEFNKDDEA